MGEEIYQKTLDRLRKLCSVREYCRKDVYDKALKSLEDASEAARLVEALLKDKYVDDARYATAFARDKAVIAGWGPMKIRYALAAKGIDRGVIDDSLSEIDSEKADAKLQKSLQVKLAQLKDDPQKKIKLLKFGLSRGYDYPSVVSAVELLLK